MILKCSVHLLELKLLQERYKLMRNEVTEKKEAGLPANLLSEMVADSGVGLSNVTADDMQIPFLRILQALCHS